MAILTSKEIGERLRELRKRRGMTQEQLAEIVDITSQQIQKYENGSTRMNTDKLQSVAQALTVPISAFFDEDNHDVRLLSAQEMNLIHSFRALPSSEVRAFVINVLLKPQGINTLAKEPPPK
jgi:transcriptional regulator with XRE-family HTH domain